ncbi:MAG TPA: hypothetical protein PLJ27_08845 [Polyangiaceae bacterium]|nr:hypothetical protein [Polyangiaceae bacterium]HNZ25129.1 hypothetical protein [Polyangiaceae bacterium]HOD22075.1 hypothetical protein [Polyangiaceae bacterium]HOE51955.1 hypothetical protein [Polyangiaceae bacterium]HOH02063.1 hypothetical protein [Polyangiaceae bacterium]
MTDPKPILNLVLPPETTRWRCQVCGIEHRGSSPPAVCPVCGVGPDFWDPLSEPTDS